MKINKRVLIGLVCLITISFINVSISYINFDKHIKLSNIWKINKANAENCSHRTGTGSKKPTMTTNWEDGCKTVDCLSTATEECSPS